MEAGIAFAPPQHWFARRRARRAFMRRFRIAQLEKANGLELSHPELDLPTIRVVRNPGGFDWEPWIAQGFPWAFTEITARSRASCVRKARERLWQMALSKTEEPTEVKL